MKHRLRAAVLIIDDGKVLLVEHVDPSTGAEWWIPPGGGLEEIDSSLQECAAREAYEETGLCVTVGRLVYLREFIDQAVNTHHVEFFFLAENFSGQITLNNVKGKGEDEFMIKQVVWLAREQLGSLVVYPDDLSQLLWQDLSAGFPAIRHLGTHLG